MIKNKLIYFSSLLTVFLITSALQAQDSFSALSAEVLNPKSQKVLVVSHRGDWRNAPENSLQAIKNVIKMGVDVVEIDIKKTKDGRLVLMHDAKVDRTTNGKGYVSDYLFDDIRKLYLKNGLGRATFHSISTLEEALILCKGKIWVNIDKGYEYMSEVYDLMEKTGTTRQVILKSGTDYEELFDKYKNILSKVVYMPIINLNDDNAEKQIEKFAHYKPLAVECVFAEETPRVIELLEKIRKNGSKIWINSLWASLCAGRDDDRAVEQGKKDQTWGWMLEHGAKMIQTDRPEELITFLDKKQMH
ncbi:glycerophosphodiester phosphodiesterase family protein [Dysgonomonas sp.]